MPAQKTKQEQKSAPILEYGIASTEANVNTSTPVKAAMQMNAGITTALKDTESHAGLAKPAP